MAGKPSGKQGASDVDMSGPEEVVSYLKELAKSVNKLDQRFGALEHRLITVEEKTAEGEGKEDESESGDSGDDSTPKKKLHRIPATKGKTREGKELEDGDSEDGDDKDESDDSEVVIQHRRIGTEVTGVELRALVLKGACRTLHQLPNGARFQRF